MVTRVDVAKLFEILKNMTCILDVKARNNRNKYAKIIDGADEKYSADEDFDKHETYIHDRIDSGDIDSIKSFCIDVVAYVSNVDKLLKTMHRGGVYILYEANSTDVSGNINDYDIMGYVCTESEAMEWRDACADYRLYKWCNMKAVNVDVRE